MPLSRKKPTKAFCLFTAAVLLLAVFFLPTLWGKPLSDRQEQRQVRGIACDVASPCDDVLMLAMPVPMVHHRAREQENRLPAWDLAAYLPSLPLSLGRAARFPLYLPVFQRHILVRVGTHAPPA